MDGTNYPPQGYRVKVTQEYEVILYFQEGMIADNDDDKYDIICEEAINAAFGEDGLTAVLHEQTESSNGYLAYVNTLEPMAEVIYNTETVPDIIGQALREQLHDKK